jgi:hypothetical protein
VLVNTKKKDMSTFKKELRKLVRVGEYY